MPGILIQSNTRKIDAIQKLIDSIFLGRARPTETRVTEHKRALKNMAGEGFDLENEFPKFLADVDNTGILFENLDSEVAEGHAEVLDKTIGLLRSMSHCYDLDTKDTENRPYHGFWRHLDG